MKPLISIIIVVYNSVQTLEDTLKSILSQTYENYQLIIIDGLSNDGTLDIIHKYKNHFNFWESTKDKGIYDAMNKGLSHVEGEFVYFLGADDIFFNNKVLETVSKYLITSTNSIFYGNVLFKTSKIIYDGKFNSLKLVTRNISHQSIFYPSKIIKKYYFSTKYKVFADYHLNLILYSKYKFIHINLLIAVFNDRGVSGTNTIDIEFKNDRLKIIKNHYSLLIYSYRLIRSFFKKIYE